MEGREGRGGAVEKEVRTASDKSIRFKFLKGSVEAPCTTDGEKSDARLGKSVEESRVP